MDDHCTKKYAHAPDPPAVDALKAEILTHSVLHADETPVSMLKPGTGKTHRAYLWAYAPGAFEDLKAVIYDFCETPAGEHARTFLGKWRGSLVCDDYAGYKAGFLTGITAPEASQDVTAFADWVIAEQDRRQEGKDENVGIKKHAEVPPCYFCLALSLVADVLGRAALSIKTLGRRQKSALWAARLV